MDTEALPPAPGAGPETAPTSAPAADTAHHRVSWPARILLATAIVVVLAIIAGFVIRVPYTTIAPGEALSLPPRISVHGAESFPDGRGDIRLLFVREANHVNLWQYVRARLDSDIDLVKDAVVNPGNLTGAQLNAQGLEAMAEAKIAATVVAMREAGYTVTPAPGLRVTDLTPGMPAIDALQWGDVVYAADGKAVDQPTELSAAIDKHKVGESVTLDIERDGKRMTVPVKVAPCPACGGTEPRRGIGVEVVPRYDLPFSVNVDTTGIGGPSAGLAMALSITDALTPGNLTGGKRVAVTGTIDPDGNVGEIGGIEQKAVAARAAGVKMFLVPECSPDDPKSALEQCRADLDRARKRVGSTVEVIPVATFKEALQALEKAGGAPVSTTVPASAAKAAA